MSSSIEMRPQRMTEAHAGGDLGELVCSNSLRSDLLSAPAGLLKAEMRRLDSLIIRCAEQHRVPAGSALAVDRGAFSARLDRSGRGSCRESGSFAKKFEQIPDDGIVIIATGPLTSPALSRQLAARLGEEHLYFYDAISPIVTAESIDMSVAFRAARYGKGGDDYLNLPLTREEYDRFIDALFAAERVPTHSFERFVPFEGCMPIEEMADRGKETLAFGPMRAVGLIDPRTGKRPYAVVQLRQENREKTLYNLVGFQTKMTYAGAAPRLCADPGTGQRRVRPTGQLAPQYFYQCAAASDADAAMAPARDAIFCRPDDRRRRLHRIRRDGTARRDQCREADCRRRRRSCRRQRPRWAHSCVTLPIPSASGSSR